jgi:hypothetical protein
MIVTGFEIVSFGLDSAAGQDAHAANQQPGGFPLGMGIDGDESIRIVLKEFACDPIQFQHTRPPILEQLNIEGNLSIAEKAKPENGLVCFQV